MRKRMTYTMTEDKFENLLDLYGCDPNHWPDHSRESALNFARTDKGQYLLSSVKKLEDDLTMLKSKTPLVSDQLLSDLYNISQHAQQKLHIVPLSDSELHTDHFMIKLRFFMRDMMNDIEQKISFKFYAVQGSFMALALCLGVFFPQISQNFDQHPPTEEYDISNDLFASLNETAGE